jgi:hypothetical protein
VLVLGLGGGYAISELGSSDRAAGGGVSERPQAVETPAGEPVSAEVEAGARDVVERFVAAEAERDWATSFILLTPADQEELGPEAVWVRSHASFPPFTGQEVLDVRALDGRIEVVGDVTLVSTLDSFVGLVPARGRMTWTVEEVDGEWRVAYRQSTLEPRYPDDGDVDEAALEWANGRQACDPGVREHGQLLGVPAIAQALCGSSGEIRASTAEDLVEGADASPFVAAYGPDVFDWARVVPLSGPVPLGAVLGPVDDRWTVIGVIRSR